MPVPGLSNMNQAEVGPRHITFIHRGPQDAAPPPLIVQPGRPEQSTGRQLFVPDPSFNDLCRSLASMPPETTRPLPVGTFEVRTAGCLTAGPQQIGPSNFLMLMQRLRQPDAAGAYFTETATRIETMVRNARGAR